MPYTLSHPAAILALGRPGLDRGTGAAALPLAALVAGSLALDIPYYTDVPVTPRATHSLVGVVTLDLGLGIALYLIWVGLLLRPALWLAPRAIQARIPPRRRTEMWLRIGSPARAGRVVLAVVLGAASHLLWDSFTHSGMWATTHLPMLNRTVSGHRLYSWLQGGSSVVGLAVIAWVLWRWWRLTPARWSTSAGHRWAAWAAWGIIVGVPAVAGARMANVQAHRRHPWNALWVQDLTIHTLLEYTSVLVMTIAAVALAWHAADLALRAGILPWGPAALPEVADAQPRQELVVPGSPRTHH